MDQRAEDIPMEGAAAATQPETTLSQATAEDESSTLPNQDKTSIANADEASTSKKGEELSATALDQDEELSTAPSGQGEVPETLNDQDEGPETLDDRDEVPETLSDHHDSDLSEIDENQFDDEPGHTLNEDDNYGAPTSTDIAKSLKASKRKDATAGGASGPGRIRHRDKRQLARSAEEDDDQADHDNDNDYNTQPARNSLKGRKKQRTRRVGGAAAVSAASTPASASDRNRSTSNEPEHAEPELTPEERRRRAISNAIDRATAMSKRPVLRRKKGDIDLEDFIDEELSQLKVRMEEACQADHESLMAGKPALQKLRLLPEVSAILSRQNALEAILDPEINFLQHVRFFLEPLESGALPAFAIQRDLLSALLRLPVRKETLISSKIGGVVLFYTRSKLPELSIKRMAESLVEEWSRPIIARTDELNKRHVEQRYFDAEASQISHVQPRRNLTTAELERERILAPVAPSRFRPTELPKTYRIAPQSTLEPGMQPPIDYRPIGASALEAFRRMTQKTQKRK